MEESLQLRVGAIFLIFSVSIIGSVLPFVLIRNGVEDLSINGTFLIVKAFAAGVILGVALLHLLAESIESLSTQVTYPCKFKY